MLTLKYENITVEVLNPEMLPEASRRFTRVMYESYKKHLIEKEIKELEQKKEVENT